MPRIGYAEDFDGVVTAGLLPQKGDVIITGRTEDQKEKTLAQLESLGGIVVPIYFYPDKEKLDAAGTPHKINQLVASHKANIINKLGVTTFFEDNPQQVAIIKKMCPNTNVVLVEPDDRKKKLKYLFFTYEGLSLPIAKKLIDEGNDVTVAQVQDISELGNEGEEEDAEMKERRLRLYDGILDKIPAEKVMKVAESIENKDEYFVFVDFNNMWKYAEELLKMGFTKGLFPTKEHLEFERDRNRAKKFVEENYPGLNVAEKQEFKSVEDAKKFLEGTNKIWALKGNSDNAKTVVPTADDPEMAAQLLLSNLETGKKDYESEGFILEEKIMNPIEFTPEIVFWNGVPVFTDIDMETKYREAGDKGIQVGCGTSLVIKTDLGLSINKTAFPPVIYEMAKKQPGLFVWDSSILVDPKNNKMYFGEYCPMRFGWDSIFAELAMAGDRDGKRIASPFFEAIVEGKNPLLAAFGTTVRLFNEHHDGFGKLKGGDTVIVDPAAEPDVYLYEAVKDGENVVSADYFTDLAVVTGFSDESWEEAGKLMYKYVDMVGFNGVGYRYLGDFLADDYPTSLKIRFQYLKKNGIIK